MGGIIPPKARMKQTPNPKTTEKWAPVADTMLLTIEGWPTPRTLSLLQKEVHLTARARRRQTTVQTGMSTNQGQHTTEMTTIRMGVPMGIGMTMMTTVMEGMTVCFILLFTCLPISVCSFLPRLRRRFLRLLPLDQHDRDLRGLNFHRFGG